MITVFKCNKIGTEQNRTYYLDCLRILATFAVMVLHISAQNWYSTDVMSFEWNVFNLYDSIVRWAVPVFVMISGSLFLSRDCAIERIYRKNILRIIVAFIFWSLLYALTYGIYRGDSIVKVVAHILQGHYHLWFLFMIVGLYIAIPFLRKISESEFLTKYFLVLALFFTFIFPQVIVALSVYSEELSIFAQKILSKVNFYLTLGYSGYFLLGHVLNDTDIPKRVERIIYILGICGFLFTVLLSRVISLLNQEPYGAFYNYLTLNVLLESIIIFVFAKRYFNMAHATPKLKNIITTLSKYSFGAYLVHDMAIQLLRVIGINTLVFNPLLSVPVIGIIVFVISYSVSAVLNHIPILEKYIV